MKKKILYTDEPMEVEVIEGLPPAAGEASAEGGNSQNHPQSEQAQP